MSSRRTLAGATLNPAATANVTMIAPVGPRVRAVRRRPNLFNVHYADPASDAHRQDVIPQNGRTFASACAGNWARNSFFRPDLTLAVGRAWCAIVHTAFAERVRILAKRVFQD